MPDICYDTADMAFLIADASAHAGTGSRRGDGANLGMFGEDQTTMDVNAWESSNSAPSSVFVEAGRDPVTDSENHVHPPNKSYKELLELSLELIEDQELLDTQAPLNSKQNHGAVCSNSQQHHPINRMLNHTTHFWGMLKRISVTSEAPQNQCSSYENTATESSSNSRHSNIGQEMMWAGAADTSYGNMDSSSLPPPSLVCLPQQDHLLIVNLVTTYVYLVRNCQGVFTRLYNALEVSPTADYSSILNLPSLQFGEFQLPNNPAIQVKVLIELISSMLLRIEETLGISQVSASRRSSLTESQNYQLSILNDPMAVSIREIILSQERMQGGIYSGELAFSDIISNLKQLLERK
ncbi:hypothetical protein IFR05_001863 [Cadophora sp. M221]|nr:hypothetical protein IFR05_001863 [Cadophora sp. M221]